LSSEPLAIGSPVAGSASLLTNYKTQEKNGIIYSSDATLVNKTYIMAVEFAERVRIGMIKSSISPKLATGCIIH
jgi:hypothetical protein